jgi:DNA repair protein RadC
VEIVRSLWLAVEGTPGADQVKLKKDIAQTINRLRGRVEGRLGEQLRGWPTERLLFDHPAEGEDGAVLLPIAPAAPRFPEPVLRVYAKDIADHALLHLPLAAKYKSVEAFRKYLAEKLRFNSEATRRRSANYIVSRFFPGDVYNADLPAFAAATAGQPALGEALFYLTCRTERIVSLVAEEVVFPSLALGGVSRGPIREYVQGKFPASKSAVHIGQSIVRTYEFYGIGTANRTRLNVSVREGSLSSFAYILHLEFPEPGMYSFERLFDGPTPRWMLWDQRWMVRQLYRLREGGLLAKVSEIDRLRQFTTKYPLADAIQPIVALAKESPHETVRP